MRRFWQLLRSVGLIAAITVGIDLAATLFVPARYLDPWVRLRENDQLIYDRTADWNHEIRPNVRLSRSWGNVRYAFASDAQGLRTGRCAADDQAAEKDNTVFVVGDSFTEGIGLSYEESYAGLLACAFRERGLVVRNLGTAAYSPVIYWRKIEATAKRLDLKPREVIVFLDISDNYNDAVDYREIDGRVVVGPRPFWQRVKIALDRNSTIYVVIREIRDRVREARGGPAPALGQAAALWTVDKSLFESWGRRGLERNAANLEKIVGQCRDWGCRLTLVVYPWPDQIDRDDRDSLQVSHWRAWSQRHGVRFVEAFSPFFAVPRQEALTRYFIPGDVHYNAAGARLVFDRVWSAIDPAH